MVTRIRIRTRNKSHQIHQVKMRLIIKIYRSSIYRTNQTWKNKGLFGMSGISMLCSIINLNKNRIRIRNRLLLGMRLRLLLICSSGNDHGSVYLSMTYFILPPIDYNIHRQQYIIIILSKDDNPSPPPQTPSKTQYK